MKNKENRKQLILSKDGLVIIILIHILPGYFYAHRYLLQTLISSKGVEEYSICDKYLLSGPLNVEILIWGKETKTSSI